MHKQAASAPSTKINNNLAALCALSETQSQPAKPTLNPDELSRLINDSPDPASAVNTVLAKVPTKSEVLDRKWRKLAVDLWSAGHPHIPVLLDLPITTEDVASVPAVQDTFALLRLLSNRPAIMQAQKDEWLLDPDDAYHLATNLPSLQGRPLVQIENEWQCLSLRRLRSTLQTLRLIRRHRGQLVIIKSRYQRFMELPLIQQYYLLWHTDAYHTNWGQFAGLWSDYINIIQSCLPLVWDLSEHALPDVPYNIRHWNQAMWDTFSPLWEHEGLLERRRHDSVLLAFVRTQSVPTAVTQVVMRDLLERYGLIKSQGEFFYWTKLGLELTAAERQEEMPCALDLLK